jgi:hypothetical protein
MISINRREFVALVSTAGATGMAGILPHKDGSFQDEHLDGHIANRRLFEFSEGNLKLEAPERRHLHECAECQTIVAVLLRQPLAMA